MRIDIVTLFPAMFQGPLTESILKRAAEKDLLQIHFHDLRQFGMGNYKQVDDRPYGGGAGMLMMCEPVVKAIESITELGLKEIEKRKDMGYETRDMGEQSHISYLITHNLIKPHRIYFTPRGATLVQERVETLSSHQWLILLCGHYEGIDQRIIDGGWIDEEISIGDYVLTGGELPAMVLIDAVARHIPGVLGKDESAGEESFSPALDRKKEYPHYTRPEEFRGLSVPPELLSGHHKEIEKWRKNQTK